MYIGNSEKTEDVARVVYPPQNAEYKGSAPHFSKRQIAMIIGDFVNSCVVICAKIPQKYFLQHFRFLKKIFFKFFQKLLRQKIHNILYLLE